MDVDVDVDCKLQAACLPSSATALFIIRWRVDGGGQEMDILLQYPNALRR
jgi:hypothetical protein